MTKRFYQKVTSGPEGGGYGVALDGKPVKTPAGHSLVVPTDILAQAIAREWDAQGDTLVPATMSLTRLANTAQDRIMGAHGDVVDAVSAYGGSDLLCHRSDSDEALCEREAAAWQPILDWAEKELGAALVVGRGVMPVIQSDEALGLYQKRVAAFDPHSLAALSEMTSLLESLVLALAVAEKHLDGHQAFTLSHLDETYQEEKWGTDPEALARSKARKADFLAACEFLTLLAG